jgi:hypothetical protein
LNLRKKKLFFFLILIFLLKTKDHCYGLRTKLLQAHESTIRQLNRFYETMLIQINKYEKETVDQFVNKNENKNRLVKLIDEVSVFHHDWTNYLKRLTIDEDQIVKTKKIAEGIKIKLEVEKHQIEGYIFNEKIMKFEKNHMDLSQNLLGSMSYEKMPVQVTDNSDLINNNNTFQKIYMKETIKGIFSMNKTTPQINSPFINFTNSCTISHKQVKVNKVGLLENGKIVATVTNNTDNYVTMLLFSKNGEFLNEAKDERFFNRLEMATNRNLVVFFGSLGLQRKEQTMTQTQLHNGNIGFNNNSNNTVCVKGLKILDEVFNTVKKVNTNFDIVSINANDSKIFCLLDSSSNGAHTIVENNLPKLTINKQSTSRISNISMTGIIKIYNWELGMLKSVGQNVNPELPFYIETPIFQILFAKGKLFLRKDNVITIIDEKFGKLVSKLECNYKVITNGSNSNIIAISRDSDRLIHLSPNGVKFCEKRLIDFPANIQPIIESNNSISFFDRDDLILYKVTQ